MNSNARPKKTKLSPELMKWGLMVHGIGLDVKHLAEDTGDTITDGVRELFGIVAPSPVMQPVLYGIVKATFWQGRDAHSYSKWDITKHFRKQWASQFFRLSSKINMDLIMKNLPTGDPGMRSFVHVLYRESRHTNAAVLYAASGTVQYPPALIVDRSYREPSTVEVSRTKFSLRRSGEGSGTAVSEKKDVKESFYQLFCSERSAHDFERGEASEDWLCFLAAEGFYPEPMIGTFGLHVKNAEGQCTNRSITLDKEEGMRPDE